MNLTNHTWSIFDIAKENDVDIGVGHDMFIANLEQRKAAYHGADMDYTTLGDAWAAMSDEARAVQKQRYSDITAVTTAGGRYSDLCNARIAGDRMTFEVIVAEAVAALEKPDEVK